MYKQLHLLPLVFILTVSASFAVEADKVGINVGVLHILTGTMSISEMIESEKCQLIFRDRVSSVTSVSETSGWGVGTMVEIFMSKIPNQSTGKTA